MIGDEVYILPCIGDSALWERLDRVFASPEIKIELQGKPQVAPNELSCLEGHSV